MPWMDGIELIRRLRVSLPDVSLHQDGDSAVLVLLGAVAGADSAFVLVSRLTIGDAALISYLILLLPEEVLIMDH